jgi:hypothetical protein
MSSNKNILPCEMAFATITCAWSPAWTALCNAYPRKLTAFVSINDSAYAKKQVNTQRKSLEIRDQDSTINACKRTLEEKCVLITINYHLYGLNLRYIRDPAAKQMPCALDCLANL